MTQAPGLFLEDFMNNVNALSVDGRKLFRSMQDCDSSCEEIIKRLPQYSRGHIALLRESLSKGEYCDESMLYKIRDDLESLRRIGEEKLALAKEVRALVDRCMEQLGQHVEHFNKKKTPGSGSHAAAAASAAEESASAIEMPDKKETTPGEVRPKEEREPGGLESMSYSYSMKFTPTYAPTAGMAPAAAESESDGSEVSEHESEPRGAARRKITNGRRKPARTARKSDGGVARTRRVKHEEEEDMQEVAGSSQWCICRQDRPGNMVACDNQSCPHGEWFHLECVNLKDVPEGKWICPWCIADSKQPQSTPAVTPGPPEDADDDDDAKAKRKRRR